MIEKEKSELYSNEEMIKAYIQTPEKYDYYISAFTKFTPESVGWKWSWWAFFGGPCFLIYRKCYLEAFVLYILNKILFGIILSSATIATNIFFLLVIRIALGGIAPYIIYKRYGSRVKIAMVQSEEFEEQLKIVEKMGGVNPYGIYIPIVLLAIGIILRLVAAFI